MSHGGHTKDILKRSSTLVSIGVPSTILYNPNPNEDLCCPQERGLHYLLFVNSDSKQWFIKGHYKCNTISKK
jgi:hypothetical protein